MDRCELKDILREVLKRINIIEKRLKVISPKVEIEKKSPKTKKIATTNLFSNQELLQKYYQFVDIYKTDKQTASTELSKLSKENLLSLSKELGCSIPNNPSPKKMIELILGRMKESVMLSGSIIKDKSMQTDNQQTDEKNR